MDSEGNGMFYRKKRRIMKLELKQDYKKMALGFAMIEAPD